MARQMDPRRPTHSSTRLPRGNPYAWIRPRPRARGPWLWPPHRTIPLSTPRRTLARWAHYRHLGTGRNRPWQADLPTPPHWADRAAFQLLDTHHIKESAARDALEEALTTFTAASTDTSTPLATNDEQRLRELGETLRARGDMSDRKVRRIEADARTFVADSGNTRMRNLVRLPHTHTASGARQQGMHAPWHTTLAWWRWWACSRCSPTHRSAQAQRFPPFSWAWPLSP